MKELIRVRVQYASRQQCCKTHKRPYSLMIPNRSFILRTKNESYRQHAIGVRFVHELFIQPVSGYTFCLRMLSSMTVTCSCNVQRFVTNFAVVLKCLACPGKVQDSTSHWAITASYNILPNLLFTDYSLGHLQQHYTMAGNT